MTNEISWNFIEENFDEIFDRDWIPDGMKFGEIRGMSSAHVQMWMRHIIDNETPVGAEGPQKRFRLLGSYTGTRKERVLVPANYCPPKTEDASLSNSYLTMPKPIGNGVSSATHFPPTKSDIAAAKEVLQGPLRQFRLQHQFVPPAGPSRPAPSLGNAETSKKPGRGRGCGRGRGRGRGRGAAPGARSRSPTTKQAPKKTKKKGKGKARANSEEEPDYDDTGYVSTGSTSEEEEFDDRRSDNPGAEDEDLPTSGSEKDLGDSNGKDVDDPATDDRVSATAMPNIPDNLTRAAPSSVQASRGSVMAYLRTLWPDKNWQDLIRCYETHVRTPST